MQTQLVPLSHTPELQTSPLYLIVIYSLRQVHPQQDIKP